MGDMVGSIMQAHHTRQMQVAQLLQALGERCTGDMRLRVAAKGYTGGSGALRRRITQVCGVEGGALGLRVHEDKRRSEEITDEASKWNSTGRWSQSSAPVAPTFFQIRALGAQFGYDTNIAPGFGPLLGDHGSTSTRDILPRGLSTLTHRTETNDAQDGLMSCVAVKHTRPL